MGEKLGPTIEQTQSGLSRVETFVIDAAKGRWGRGAAVVLGIPGSFVIADYLAQNLVSAQVVELPPTATATPLPPIATVQAMRGEAEKTSARVVTQTAVAESTRTAIADTTATMVAAKSTAIAIHTQLAIENPEWAKEKERDLFVGGIGFWALIVGLPALAGATAMTLIKSSSKINVSRVHKESHNAK